jgi:hypothetical protein
MRRSRRLSTTLLCVSIASVVTAAPWQNASLAKESAIVESQPPTSILAPESTNWSIQAGPSALRLQESLVAAADRLQAVVRSTGAPHQDSGFGAIELDPDSNAIDVYWKQDMPVPQSLTDLGAAISSSGYPVRFHLSPYSRTELTTEARRLMEEAVPAAISEVSLQQKASGLTVELSISTQDLTSVEKAVTQMESRLRSRRAAHFGPALSPDVTRTVGHLKRTLSRLNDSYPWYGGAEIAIDNNLCSSGFAVGSWFGSYLLTAGHCSNWVDNVPVFNGSGVLMGVTEGAHSTLIDNYGDSMLIRLKVSSIGRIYNGVSGPGEFTSYVKRAVGSYVNQYVCTDGSFSGERCNIKVESTTAFIYLSPGYKVGTVVKARQIDGLSASGPGDSGGPVFALDAQSNILAAGIINAGDSSPQIACSGIIFDSRFGNRTCSNVVYYTDIWTLLDEHGVWLDTN